MTPTPRRAEALRAAGPADRDARPPFRRLRGYAFDPSLSLQFDTALINEVVFQVPWESPPELGPGPVGEYLEVVDYDAASECFYAPVNLDSPLLLAQDGLPPSDAEPRFHQQMVYAVAMTTIHNFERALGRRALWAPRTREKTDGGGRGRETYVHRLRVYPHAMREANAYYSPAKKALLFGYFPAGDAEVAVQVPGDMVFTCLSHDIIAHETTHALIDGMQRSYLKATNPDVLAFHEAIADIVALFQHFTFPDVLRHQIARKRGDLASQSLLGELAQQFGRAIGQRGALRSALGATNPRTGEWEPKAPDPEAYRRETEPHALGAILVSAVFDAFITIYRSRVADLFRLATSGSGVLPPGAIHPDLVNRLADEAAKSAQHVLNMCIRALDYCPPVDLEFGEFLRAIITADADLVPHDDRHYRIAFIEAFRRHGILPSGARGMSEESLRWQPARLKGASIRQFAPIADELYLFRQKSMSPATDRARIFQQTRGVCEELKKIIRDQARSPLENFERLTGLVLSKQSRQPGIERERSGLPRFEVQTVRAAQRIGPDGDALNQLVIVLTQRRRLYHDPVRGIMVPGRMQGAHREAFFGGCTLILDLNTMELSYAVRKNVLSRARRIRQARMETAATGESLRSTYFRTRPTRGEPEPFALLHRSL